MTSLLVLAVAVGQADDPVKAAVTATVEAARKRDWHAYAKSMLPGDLKAFRSDWVPLLEGLNKAEPDRQRVMLGMFPGVKDVDAVLKLTPEEFLAKIMAGTDRGMLFRGPVTETTVILGVVPEGIDQAHVVVRASRKWADRDLSLVEVMTVRKADGAWKTEMSQVLKQLGVAMRASATATAGAAVSVIAEDKPMPPEERPKK